MEALSRSASLGPPKSAERASGFMGRAVAGGAEGSVEEFSVLHLRRVERFGSMLSCVLGGGWLVWLGSRYMKKSDCALPLSGLYVFGIFVFGV